MKHKILSILAALFLVLSFTGAKNADGTGDGWTINNPNKGSTTFSVGCWFYDDSLSEDGAVVNYGVGGVTGFDIHEYTAPSLYILSYIPSLQGNSGTFSVSASAWHHVMITHSGTSTKMYLDATDSTPDLTDSLDSPVVQASTDDFQIALPIPSDPFGSPLGSFKWAHCVYYDAELTGAEVASLADKSTCPDAIATHSANLQIFLKGTSGSAVTDSSANAFTVVETGDPTDDAGPGGLPCDGAAATSSVAILDALGEL